LSFEIKKGAMMAHKQRVAYLVAYLDYLRLVAILGGITIHVATSLNFYRQDYASLNWQILNFWDGLSRFCVPFFIMISGAIFLNPDFDLSWEKLFNLNFPLTKVGLYLENSIV
jgi:uncharacterized membrane protein